MRKPILVCDFFFEFCKCFCFVSFFCFFFPCFLLCVFQSSSLSFLLWLMLFFLLSQKLTFNLNPHHAWLENKTKETAKKKYETNTDDYGNAPTLFFQFVSSLDKGIFFCVSGLLAALLSSLITGGDKRNVCTRNKNCLFGYTMDTPLACMLTEKP